MARMMQLAVVSEKRQGGPWLSGTDGSGMTTPRSSHRFTADPTDAAEGPDMPAAIVACGNPAIPVPGSVRNTLPLGAEIILPCTPSRSSAEASALLYEGTRSTRAMSSLVRPPGRSRSRTTRTSPLRGWSRRATRPERSALVPEARVSKKRSHPIRFSASVWQSRICPSSAVETPAQAISLVVASSLIVASVADAVSVAAAPRNCHFSPLVPCKGLFAFVVSASASKGGARSGKVLSATPPRFPSSPHQSLCLQRPRLKRFSRSPTVAKHPSAWR